MIPQDQGTKIRIAELPTLPPASVDKKALEDATDRYINRIGDLHKVLYAQKKYAVLIVLQGMDASGKDGAVENVFRKCHPNGLSVYSFKKPTDEEFAHDFLWRVHKQAPERGNIKIFIRSHYEDVLIQRVHGWIDGSRVDKRFQAINAFEELLAFDNHTLVLKFFLNISYEQQAIELQQRIDDKEKHWKHNPNDWKEREFWADYMHCYEDMLNRSTIPWTTVPVDKRWYRDYIIAKKVAEEMEKLPLEYPPLPQR